jgi:galactose-1-phosphate uridylyltransferase
MTELAPQRSIGRLDKLVSALPLEDRRRFEQIFHLDITTGELVPPETMHTWLAAQFGSLQAARRQRIIRITNRATMEGALFNALRARRPNQAPPLAIDVQGQIENRDGCDFCHPQDRTPADQFGRIQGEHCITASNVAKGDGWHAVVIFDEHHPLRFTASQVADYVDTAQEWAQSAHRADPAACYPFFLWNCLWRSGASIIHGHAQVTVTRDMHYARVEHWRQAALRYHQQHGGDYFDDLLAIQRALGLVVDHGSASILASLTPTKEKEILILSSQLGPDLKSALYHTLHTLVEQLGVQSFNVGLYQPPLCDTTEDWTCFPFVFRIVSRGNLQSTTADVGAMEFFAQNIVVTDPFRLVDALDPIRREETP